MKYDTHKRKHVTTHNLQHTTTLQYKQTFSNTTTTISQCNMKQYLKYDNHNAQLTTHHNTTTIQTNIWQHHHTIPTICYNTTIVIPITTLQQNKCREVITRTSYNTPQQHNK